MLLGVRRQEFLGGDLYRLQGASPDKLVGSKAQTLPTFNAHETALLCEEHPHLLFPFFQLAAVAVSRALFANILHRD